MQLITVLLLCIGLWIVYQIYIAYNNIVKELKQIKDKCITSGISKKEAFRDYIDKNTPENKLIDIKNSVLSFLNNKVTEMS